jgi:hypothetical protein
MSEVQKWIDSEYSKQDYRNNCKHRESDYVSDAVRPFRSILELVKKYKKLDQDRFKFYYSLLGEFPDLEYKSYYGGRIRLYSYNEELLPLINNVDFWEFIGAGDMMNRNHGSFLLSYKTPDYEISYVGKRFLIYPYSSFEEALIKSGADEEMQNKIKQIVGIEKIQEINEEIVEFSKDELTRMTTEEQMALFDFRFEEYDYHD